MREYHKDRSAFSKIVFLCIYYSLQNFKIVLFIYKYLRGRIEFLKTNPNVQIE